RLLMRLHGRAVHGTLEQRAQKLHEECIMGCTIRSHSLFPLPHEVPERFSSPGRSVSYGVERSAVTSACAAAGVGAPPWTVASTARRRGTPPPRPPAARRGSSRTQSSRGPRPWPPCH